MLEDVDKTVGEVLYELDVAFKLLCNNGAQFGWYGHYVGCAPPVCGSLLGALDRRYGVMLLLFHEFNDLTRIAQRLGGLILVPVRVCSSLVRALKNSDSDRVVAQSQSGSLHPLQGLEDNAVVTILIQLPYNKLLPLWLEFDSSAVEAFQHTDNVLPVCWRFALVDDFPQAVPAAWSRNVTEVLKGKGHLAKSDLDRLGFELCAPVLLVDELLLLS